MAFGPGSAMANMDPVVCYVLNNQPGCEDYTSGQGVKDSSNSINFNSAESSFTNGQTAIWTFTWSTAASDNEDKAFDSESMTFVYAYGTYSGIPADHGANKGTTTITLPTECVSDSSSSRKNNLI